MITSPGWDSPERFFQKSFMYFLQVGFARVLLWDGFGGTLPLGRFPCWALLPSPAPRSPALAQLLAGTAECSKDPDSWVAGAVPDRSLRTTLLSITAADSRELWWSVRLLQLKGH